MTISLPALIAEIDVLTGAVTQAKTVAAEHLMTKKVDACKTDPLQVLADKIGLIEAKPDLTDFRSAVNRLTTLVG